MYTEYKKIKNSITWILGKNKKEHYQNYFKSQKNNIKKVWKGIQEFINVKSKTDNTPTGLRVEDEYKTDLKEISNTFNDYFTSIADDILKKENMKAKRASKIF